MTNDEAVADAAAADIRPVVAQPSNNRAAWIFCGVILAVAVGLFSALEARRGAISSPATAVPPASTAGMIAPPPALAIPPAYDGYGAPQFALVPQGPPAGFAAPAIVPRTPVQRVPSYTPPAQSYASPAAQFGPPPPPEPAFAYRAGPQPPASPLSNNNEASVGSSGGKGRVQASRFLNPATTVPQGTIIQAVLETALDSNHAGFARAVISRDVMSFDGSRVLIPRGSKLFGEYRADLSPGQNRAMIQWGRLTRPDGGIIDVGSPSADPLGRAGVKGKVNSHFFTRFSGAILQSALDIGTGIATRSVSGDSYYIGVPGAMQGMIQQRPEQIKPTLTTRQGASVSVFVARDLDFTSVEQ